MTQRLAHDWFPRPLPLNVELAEGSWLYSSFAFIHCRSMRPAALRLGRHSGVYNSSFFELGPEGEVEVGEYCTLVGVIVAANRRVEIGNYCFLAHQVVIADSPYAKPCYDAEAVGGLGPLSIVVGDDVWVGVGAVLMSGAHIGSGCIVGAGAIVDFEVPPDMVVAGNPARVVGSARRGV